MLTRVPESSRTAEDCGGLHFLAEALDGLLELTGATAGWVGLTGPDGLLTIAARRGPIPEGWLALQQGRVPVWGFQIEDGPALLNDLAALPALGEPSLGNLLVCPLLKGAVRAGQVALANKPGGFTAADAMALQTTAHLLGRQLAARPTLPVTVPSTTLWHRTLDQVPEGVLVVDADGILLFANAAWTRWTGFSVDELRNRSAPFPFWVSPADLAGPGLSMLTLRVAPQPEPAAVPPIDAPTSSPLYLPFRHRDRSVFWCQVEQAVEVIDGRPVVVALLRRLPTSQRPGEDSGAAIAFSSLMDGLPFAMVLTDRRGQVLWTNTAFRENLLWSAAPGQSLRQVFTATSVAALDRVLHPRSEPEPAHRGRLVLEQADPGGRKQTWVAVWLAVELAGGPGFLFALAEDWAALCPADEAPAPWQQAGTRPIGDWLALLYRPGQPLGFWDARWSQLTGLSAADQAGVAGEMVLDWLFPRQRDRDWVADLLQHPARCGSQAVLELVGPGGSQPLLCTLLPLAPADGWLLLVGEPEVLGDTTRLLQRFLQPFARELGRLLDRDTAKGPRAIVSPAPSGGVQDRVSWLGRLLDNCLRACQLLVALQDLGGVVPTSGESERVRLAVLVRAFLDEHADELTAAGCELTVEISDAESEVRANPALLKLVLAQLLSRAVGAVRGRERRCITVRVYPRDAEVACEIADTGAGWPIADWDALLAASALLPPAPDTLSLDPSGLALTVSQHLLTLQGGELELRSRPGEGTTALLRLPRAEAVSEMKKEAESPREGLRPDVPGGTPRPHAKIDSGARLEETNPAKSRPLRADGGP
jgi:PAS domain-containing protein